VKKEVENLVKLMVQVLDKADSRPLPWVSVVVNEISANTDAQGRSAFEVAAGRYLLKIRTQAYQPFTGHIDVPETPEHAVRVKLQRALL
jgi:hypothetical protein